MHEPEGVAFLACASSVQFRNTGECGLHEFLVYSNTSPLQYGSAVLLPCNDKRLQLRRRLFTDFPLRL